MTDQYPQDTPIGSDQQAEPAYDAIPPQAPTPIARRQPKRLDPKAARARRAQRNATFEFPLPNTLDEDGTPTSALARRPALLEADELRHLPDHMQQSIFKLMEQTEAFEGMDTAGQEAQVATLARSYGSIADMADGYVLRGFVEPKVYATAEEADAEGGVWLYDIALDDRMAFFDLCTNARERAAQTAAPFRDGSVGAVPARPAGDAIPGAGEPEPDPAPAAAARG